VETIDVSPEVERLSLELLDELGGNEIRVTDPRSVPLRVSHLEQFVRSPAHVRHSMVSGYGDQTLSTRIGSGTRSRSGRPRSSSTPSVGPARNGTRSPRIMPAIAS
jgi:hypothetical protein